MTKIVERSTTTTALSEAEAATDTERPAPDPDGESPASVRRFRRRAAVGMSAALAVSATFTTHGGPDAAASPRVPPTNAFPIPSPHPPTFSDDWHACRDDCSRRHKGNDIFADEGTSLVAVEPGVITKVDNTDDSKAGVSIWLKGDSGVSYFYAHNASNEVTAGERVNRGETIGRVSRTGNARTTPPHVHFQINVCGERSSKEPCTVNPYRHLRSWPQQQVDGGPDAVGLYRPSDGSIELRNEGGSPLPAVDLGPAGRGDIIPAAGDWDGDGRDTIDGYRRSSESLVAPPGEDEAPTAEPPLEPDTSNADPVLLAGDWDGDGRDNLAEYRRSDATFVLDNSNEAAPPTSIPVGTPGATDVFPVAGDWDGDGHGSLGLYDQQDGVFQLWDEAGNRMTTSPFGPPGAPALPIAGDWDGDGRDTVGTFQPDGTFTLGGPDIQALVERSRTIHADPTHSDDAVPVAGDWNGHDLVTIGDLRSIFGPLVDEPSVAADLPLLNAAMQRASITTPARKAAFLTTIRHQSNFDAQAEEQGRKAYRGRGLIQLTGKANYRTAGAYLGVDLKRKPSLASTDEVSSAAAAWYWTIARDMNYAADRLDIAAINIAVTPNANGEEDAAWCADFQKALAWFNGGQVPEGVNCDRSVALSIPVPSTPADRTSTTTATATPTTAADAPSDHPALPMPQPDGTEPSDKTTVSAPGGEASTIPDTSSTTVPDVTSTTLPATSSTELDTTSSTVPGELEPPPAQQIDVP